jgi:type I restriction enzyme S subunit
MSQTVGEQTAEARVAGLPPGWTWTTLGEISEVNPKNLPVQLTDQLDVTFLPMRAVEELSGRYDLSYVRKAKEVRKGYTPIADGDIIFAKITPCMENGKVALLHNLLNGVGFASTEFHVFRFPRELQRKYFFYFLIQEDVRKNARKSMTGSAGQLRVPAKYMSDLPLPLPPLPEQRRIVAKIEELFSKLDAGVEALKKVKAELKRYHQAVLKYAFEGKLTEEWREAHKGELEPASVLLERIKEERKKKLGAKYKEPPPIDTSKLPDLPEGWAWARLGQIADSIEYGYTARAEEEEVGPKFLRITDIQNSVVDWDKVPYCRIDENRKRRYLVREGDLVFARTGATVGKSYLIRKHVPEAVFASYLIRIRSHRDISSEFLYSFFQSAFYWRQITESQVGIGQPNVNGARLAQIVFPLPPFHEQQIIVSEIERRFSVADEVEKVVEQSLKQAERLRQSILKRAFEGKLVPQDPTDEPASVLLERIKAEKAQREAERKATKRPKTKSIKGQMRLMQHGK